MAEVSSRHLSYVETGRSIPSRELILHLAELLKVPLRDPYPALVKDRYWNVIAPEAASCSSPGGRRPPVLPPDWAAAG